MSEFALIRRHFSPPTRHTDLAGGDDGALFTPAPGMQLVVSTDMLVAGTHFLAESDAQSLGWKIAAVNISDMAAMGAQPRWIVLAAALPDVNEPWIADVARGFSACCAHFDTDWVGGDTTRGPLNFCATVFGELPTGSAVRRDGATAGDDIWVSGWPGLAALGLAHLLEGFPLQGDWRDLCLRALNEPQPRVALGIALRGVASAMLDVSDGVAGDLRHILTRSCVGAVLDESALPLAPLLAASNDAQRARRALLGGGDDYELLFTAAPGQRETVLALGHRCGIPLSRIGSVTSQQGRLAMRHRDGSTSDIATGGFDHFGSSKT